ncbi:MAG: hypothetical protein ACJ0FR_01670 [Gammaproteobacteria bacterium]|nr:MAG: hypothetical protein CBD94_02550 [Gammaproteobacteria bacterium TMED234]|tara:strand:- start:250 stop:717 length:468 start_codon:yes stop_codon:yes gene_type:complete
MRKKINLRIFLIIFIFVQSCELNQFEQAKISSNSYLLIFDSSIPTSFQTKLNSIFKLKNDDQNKSIQIKINNYVFKKYDIYSGNSLRALESEAKSSIRISIDGDKVINKTLMSMKRFSSIELNPLAEQEMMYFIENELLEDLLNQITLEVNVIDM